MRLKILTFVADNVTTLQQEKETLQMQVMQAVTEYEKVRKQADTQGTYINQLIGKGFRSPSALQ